MYTQNKKISIKDIAKELGLSTTTVSFVINGKTSSIGPATVKKVTDYIKQTGFNPNSAARLLRTGKSKTIGLIVEDIGNFFFGNMAKIIEMEAHKNGYNLFLSSTEGKNETAKALISKMQHSSVDGLIITATPQLAEDIEMLKNENLPFVLIDRVLPGVDTNYVILDNYKGGYELTKHLLINGYSNIGFITIKQGMSQMIDRQRGFEDAMTDAEPGCTQNILEVTFNDVKMIRLEIEKFLTAHPCLDALFFATNYLGVLGIEVLKKCGLMIGKDIAVVSFDDNDLFRLMTPSITVAAQPVTELGAKSIHLLLKIIKKEQKKSEFIKEIVEPLIIIRDSSPVKQKAIALAPYEANGA